MAEREIESIGISKCRRQSNAVCFLGHTFLSCELDWRSPSVCQRFEICIKAYAVTVWFVMRGAAAYPNIALLVCVCAGAALPFGKTTVKLGSFIRGQPFRTSIEAFLILPPIILHINVVDDHMVGLESCRYAAPSFQRIQCPILWPPVSLPPFPNPHLPDY
jgi:hypothetical protein